MQRTHLDHGAGALSTDAGRPDGSPAGSASEPENALRYRPALGRPDGHVESHFLKANSPDGQRALWVKHTLLVPARKDAPAWAEVWAIAFDRGGQHKLAHKQTYPLAAAQFQSAPFLFALPDAELRHGAARGAIGPLGKPEAALGWDLQYETTGAPFRPFRYAGMYTGGFPRSKSLTPVPDTRIYGSFTALGERWELDGWRGAQGHNWGKSHAHAYAWAHCNVFSREVGGPPLADVWFEALSGQVRLGPVVTPWLSVAGLQWEGRRFRFDGLAAILSRKIAIDARSYRFALRQDGATLEGEFRAEPSQFAGLRYEDPDGRALACLNCKLASGQLTLSYPGRTVVLHTRQAALELGTRRGDHGVAMLA